MGLSKRRKALITLATLIGTFLAALDSTVVGTAMPTVIGELGGLKLYPWAFASYLLAATVTGPVFGKLSDTYGRKPVYLVGIFLFLLGSVLAGTSQSMAALISFRTLQGLGAGAVQPVAITIVGDIFELETRARIQGLFGAVWGISAVVGPAAGGFITDLISWRWVFYVNVPFGIVAAVLLSMTLTETFERRARSVDYLGTVLLTGGLVAVLLALLGGGGARELSVATLALFFGGVAVLALFVLVERRAADPIVPLDLFGERIIAVSALGNLAMGGVLLGVSVYVPLFVQGALGGTAITAGAAVASLSIGWPVGSFVGGRMLLLTGYRTTLLLGSTLIALGSALCVPMDGDTSLAYVVLAVVVIGLGLGFSSTSYLVSVQNAVPWRRRGVATSSVVFFRTVGGARGRRNGRFAERLPRGALPGRRRQGRGRRRWPRTPALRSQRHSAARCTKPYPRGGLLGAGRRTRSIAQPGVLGTALLRSLGARRGDALPARNGQGPRKPRGGSWVRRDVN